MDHKFLNAICLAYGNYRAAISAADADSNNADHYANVVASGKALLALQEALEVEVANVERVKLAVENARDIYLDMKG